MKKEKKERKGHTVTAWLVQLKTTIKWNFRSSIILLISLGYYLFNFSDLFYFSILQCQGNMHFYFMQSREWRRCGADWLPISTCWRKTSSGCAHSCQVLPTRMYPYHFEHSPVKRGSLFLWSYLVFSVQNIYHILRAYGCKSGIITLQFLKVLEKVMTLHFGFESVWFVLY